METKPVLGKTNSDFGEDDPTPIEHLDNGKFQSVGFALDGGQPGCLSEDEAIGGKCPPPILGKYPLAGIRTALLERVHFESFERVPLHSLNGDVSDVKQPDV